MMPKTTRPGPRTAGDIEQDWRFAELVAQSWVDDGLIIRYRDDPHAVLAEFDLRLGHAAPVPALPDAPKDDLLIEDLSCSSALALPSGFCIGD